MKRNISINLDNENFEYIEEKRKGTGATRSSVINRLVQALREGNIAVINHE